MHKNRLHGARLHDMRTLAAWSMDQVCEAAAECGGVLDVPKLSRVERNLASLPDDRVALIEKILRKAIAERSAEIAKAITGWREQADRASVSA